MRVPRRVNRPRTLQPPATLFFDYPTPDALVGFLRSDQVPLARFRKAGLLDMLLSLIGPEDGSAPRGDDSRVRPGDARR
ncbi:hypothetical protein GCM10010521_68530 [Streptomyces rameus]|uniref:Uncharacterized protein n=1 Tax=Streptomyces rameus TaxID=68261 RepID=A0ABN3V5Z8_9ACTN